MSPDELISVVIPTYNRAGTLKRAIDSVLNQDYRNIEVIVVDDASSDGTGEILAAMSDPRLRVVVHDTNRGVAAATNTGIRAARQPPGQGFGPPVQPQQIQKFGRRQRSGQQ